MNASLADASKIAALFEAAQRAYEQGRESDAVRTLEQVLAIAPNHPRALNTLGIRALKSGNAREAKALLERAAASAPEVSEIWQNLAMACRGVRDDDGELAALEKVLALNPSSFLALLQKAQLFDRQGNARQAASVYRAVLICAPPTEQLPPAIQTAMARAADAVRAHNVQLEEFLREHMAAARACHDGQMRARFDDCIDALLGKKRIYVQEPSFLHFPYLPAIQFYDRGSFPWLEMLEAETGAIRAELMRVLAEDDDRFVPYVANPEGVPLNQWQELNNSKRWSIFSLWRDGQRVDEHCARCPQTAAALEKLPMADVPGRAPGAFFSLLYPHTRIPSHTGVTNTRLIVHLPLIVPEKCGFRVGSEVREWQAGRAWVFDDTIEHEAWNDSDLPRAILIFDIWNPYLSEAERDLVRSAIQGLEAFYQGNSPLAGAL